MNPLRVAILGAGSVRCSPAVIASLATYFGERPLEIRMFDADFERLDLFDRFARVCFETTRNDHKLTSTMEDLEAIDGAERIILHIGENCARKYLRERHRRGIAELVGAAMIEQAIEAMLAPTPQETEVLNLQRRDVSIPHPTFQAVDWIREPTIRERFALPHQVLRWIRSEEYPFEFLKEHERSPLKRWLDDVTSLEWTASSPSVRP